MIPKFGKRLPGALVKSITWSTYKWGSSTRLECLELSTRHTESRGTCIGTLELTGHFTWRKWNAPWSNVMKKNQLTMREKMHAHHDSKKTMTKHGSKNWPSWRKNLQTGSASILRALLQSRRWVYLMARMLTGGRSPCKLLNWTGKD